MARFVPVIMVFACVALAAGLVVAFTETACSPVIQSGPARDVPFFLAHPDERNAKIIACQDNRRDAASDAECENARAALIGRVPVPATNTSLRDVPFYLAHPDEMAAKLAACRENPGGTVLDAECLNARSASIRLATDPANKSMPSVDWKF